MIDQTFTFDQALAICRDYQHWVGKAYDGSDTIECIAISPLDPLNKYIFNTYYLDSKDAVKALQFYYGPYYDVMVISSMHLKYMDLRSFLKSRNIVFEKEKYASLP